MNRYSRSACTPPSVSAAGWICLLSVRPSSEMHGSEHPSLRPNASPAPRAHCTTLAGELHRFGLSGNSPADNRAASPGKAGRAAARAAEQAAEPVVAPIAAAAGLLAA